MNRLGQEDRTGVASRAAVLAAGTRSRPSAVWLLPMLPIIFGLLLADTARTVRAQSSADEYRVKAAFLFHFVQLVEWPAGSLGNEINPLTLCTIGDDPFRGDLEGTLAGKTVEGRALRVRHLKPTEQVQGCQVVFVSRNDVSRLVPLLEELKNGPILTVGESEGFVLQGGMIGFCLVDNKVRFEINLEAAERARLKLSSRLLLLAKTVVGNHG